MPKCLYFVSFSCIKLDVKRTEFTKSRAQDMLTTLSKVFVFSKCLFQMHKIVLKYHYTQIKGSKFPVLGNVIEKTEAECYVTQSQSA